MCAPPASWHSAWQVLESQLLRLPPAKRQWREEASSRGAVLPVWDDLERVEDPHKEEIEWAISLFCKTKEWPEMSENARFFVRLRCEQAAGFVFRHFRPRTHESIFPFPEPMDETLLWLLTAWWELHGRQSASIGFVVKYDEET